MYKQVADLNFRELNLDLNIIKLRIKRRFIYN